MVKNATITVNELFSGIGAQKKALQRIGIKHEIAEFSEIDSKLLAQMFEDFNFEEYGDLTGYSENEYKELIDVIEEA